MSTAALPLAAVAAAAVAMSAVAGSGGVAPPPARTLALALPAEDRPAGRVVTAPGAATAVVPVRPAVLLRPFDPPPERWSRGHRGVDLGTDVTASVVAPAAGVVVFSGWVVDRGVVTVDHGGGLRSSLEPVVDGPPAGTAVAVGDVVGRLDPTTPHCAAGPCVHWGVRDGADDYLDPLSLLPGGGPVRLLPTGAPVVD